MKILICGAGAIGSNIARSLVPDLGADYEITILDRDTVEQRNIDAGTQFYMPDQVGMSKVEALQFNLYKHYQREVQIMDGELGRVFTTLDIKDFELTIDCFDNTEARSTVQNGWMHNHIRPDMARNLMHVGFSNQYTFAIEWAENYQIPTDIEGLDICTMPGAAAFVSSVASLGTLVAGEFVREGKKLEILGGKFEHRIIK